MQKKGIKPNSVSGRPKGFAYVDMVQSIHIQDQEKNLEPFKVKVHLWNTIHDLKLKIQALTGYPAARQRLFYNNNELENQKTLDSYNLLTVINVIALRLRPDIDQMNSYIEVYGSVECNKRMKKIIESIRQGFNSGLIPKLTDDGTSGSYAMRNVKKERIAIFKPIDEEQFAPNNPRGHQGPFGSQTFRPGVLSGESCIREVSAYLIDRKGFSGVPATTFVEVVHNSLKYVPFTGLEVTSDTYFEIMSSLIKPVDTFHTEEVKTSEIINNKSIQKTPDSQTSTHVDSQAGGSGTQSKVQSSVAEKIAKENHIGMKFGSLQYFVKSEGAISDFSADKFHKDEIHKIAILDLRILNLDRNDGNLLVQTKVDKKTGKKVWTIVPIDHGLCIPDNLAVCTYDLFWLSCERQANAPFSKRSLAFIESIDIMEDIKLLESTFKFRPICLRNIRITSLLLVHGALAGLNLTQIGQILCRPDEDDTQPSLLERIVDKARLIADMMVKMQSKVTDSNLRNIDDRRNKTFRNMDLDGTGGDSDGGNEESKLGGGNGMSGGKHSLFPNRGKRQRINSINDNQFASNMGNKQSQLPFSAFAALSGMGASDSDDTKYRIEAKKRGMSDVDDTNIKQLQENTTNMIQAQLSRMASTTQARHPSGDINLATDSQIMAGGALSSPKKSSQRNNINNFSSSTEFMAQNSSHVGVSNFMELQLAQQNTSDQKTPSSDGIVDKKDGNSPADNDNDSDSNSDEDNFYDCNDKQEESKQSNQQQMTRTRANTNSSVTSFGTNKPGNKPLRRTASFSNIQIQEATNEEEEDDDDYGNGNSNNKDHGKMLSPDKQRMLKMKAIQQHERFSKGKSANNFIGASRVEARSYFQVGSKRNSAHDEEFFHCFVSFLDEAIQKLKAQEGDGSNINIDDDYGDEDKCSD